jgi:4-hydroxy-3-methylbut-2-en-1-yl diphosphate synthase IspG/GcpE
MSTSNVPAECPTCGRRVYELESEVNRMKQLVHFMNQTQARIRPVGYTMALANVIFILHYLFWR